jgi:5'-nucleotidase
MTHAKPAGKLSAFTDLPEPADDVAAEVAPVMNRPVVNAASRAVLVTNDDGISSEGLRQLALAAAASGLTPVVAAPAQESSGSSAAMTSVATNGRIVVERRELAGLDGVAAYAVEAVPAFIAFTGARGAFGASPDLVLSGINRGPSTGWAVLHSGTVGAAMTAATSGVQSVAFSLDVGHGDGGPQWPTAAAVVAEVIKALEELPPGVVLNVNIPNVPHERLRGIRYGSLAEFGVVQLSVVETAEDHVQVSMTELGGNAEPGSDSALLADGYASVTALRPVCEASASWLDVWPTRAG